MKTEPGHRMDESAILDVAINGIKTKDHNPNVPQTPDEIIAIVYNCLDAGVTMIHAHNRDPNLVAEQAAKDYLTVWRTIIRERLGTLWYPTAANAEPRQWEGHGGESGKPIGAIPGYCAGHVCEGGRTSRKRRGRHGGPKSQGADSKGGYC